MVNGRGRELFLKNHQITLKKVLSHENRLKNALFTANNAILRFLFAQD
jgi:hypothetical protein